MGSDNFIFLAIAVIGLLLTVATAYFIAGKRHKKYIIYADSKMVKTTAQVIYDWKSLTRIHFINKYVAGKGAMEINDAIEFYFEKGIAVIDRKSNIYESVFQFSKSLQAPRTSVVTKGLLFVKEK